jgi:predicted Zn finger-like uncharacterized protein
MRITCPNCGAQYEVDDALIPEGGRDVQCSNCGKGWFQARHPEPDETAEDDGVETAEEAVAVEESAVEESAVEEAGLREAAAETSRQVEDAGPEAVAPEPPPPAPVAPAPVAPAQSLADEDEDEEDAPAALPARKTDDAVLSVLREEAEREIAQRRQESAGIESQPDLGLAEPVERRATPSAAEIAAGAAVAGAARRDLLPDIDEINSTLRSDADRAAYAGGESGVEVERRRGFRMGFGLVLLLVAALIGLYAGADWLARTVPALEPALSAYVTMANGFRAWLDGLLAAGTAGLSG